MIVDEVSAVTILFPVEIRLGDGLVGEEVVVGELKDESETGSVEILHPYVGQRAEGLFVTVCNQLSERDLVLHSGEPELRNAFYWLRRISLFLTLGFLCALLVLFLVLASIDFFFSGLGLTIDDLGSLFVKRREFGKVLFLKL